MRRDISLPAGAGAGVRVYLLGQPLDLTQSLPALDRLEATGSGDQFRVLPA